MAPFIGDVDSTQCGTWRCREREPSTPSMANNVSPLRRISFALRSSRFSRSSAFIFSAISVGMPPRRPLSTSAFLTHSFRVCGVQPIFAAIDITACQRDPC